MALPLLKPPEQRGTNCTMPDSRGRGMTIAVIDAGFHNLDKITAMRNIRVLGMKDFVNPQADLFAASSHGLSVLSCIGMNQPGIMTGTAPEASFWLLRSEDEVSGTSGGTGLLGCCRRVCRQCGS